MSKRQHIGSHTNHARPDEKMAVLIGRSWDMRQRSRLLPDAGYTTAQRQTMQKVAAKKRRQRDREQ